MVRGVGVVDRVFGLWVVVGLIGSIKENVLMVILLFVLVFDDKRLI